MRAHQRKSGFLTLSHIWPPLPNWPSPHPHALWQPAPCCLHLCVCFCFVRLFVTFCCIFHMWVKSYGFCPFSSNVFTWHNVLNGNGSFETHPCCLKRQYLVAWAYFFISKITTLLRFLRVERVNGAGALRTPPDTQMLGECLLLR